MQIANRHDGISPFLIKVLYGMISAIISHLFLPSANENELFPINRCRNRKEALSLCRKQE